MFLIIARTAKESLSNFWRNGWLSVAAVSVLLLSLFIFGAVFMIMSISDNALKTTQEKINISVYLKSDVTEEKTGEIRKELEKIPGVAQVDYISREQALTDFKKNNADEPVIIQSLEEIGDNPLLASLIIKASDPQKYEDISKQISSSSFKDEVSRINYARNKELIDKLNNLVDQIRKIGLSLVSLFSIISILIIFNTIRITIYTHRQEIEVMRLVGASNTYIRLPFVFEGILYGLLASLISMGLLFTSVKFISSFLPSLFADNLLVSLFFKNALSLFSIELLAGIILGVLSSIIAMRKYLKI